MNWTKIEDAELKDITTLIASNGSWVGECHYSQDRFWYGREGFRIEMKGITHVMPLPNKPSDKSD